MHLIHFIYIFLFKLDNEVTDWMNAETDLENDVSVIKNQTFANSSAVGALRFCKYWTSDTLIVWNETKCKMVAGRKSNELPDVNFE